MKIKAKLKNLRISPRKVRVSADLIRGSLVEEAIFRLSNVNKKANEPLRKLVESARANAENNFGVDLNEFDLRVSEIKVGEGMTLKRWRPRAYGRAAQILKRTSHIYLTLETEEKNNKEVENNPESDREKVDGNIEKVKNDKGPKEETVVDNSDEKADKEDVSKEKKSDEKEKSKSEKKDLKKESKKVKKK